MSNNTENVFVSYLQTLADPKRGDRAAMAVLRRSLGFDPGDYPPALRYVERYTGSGQRPPREAWRQACYLLAGLFSLHPEHEPERSIGQALGQLHLKRQNENSSKGIEPRFIALLSCDEETLAEHLRHAINLLKAAKIGFNYTKLFYDLAKWLDPRVYDERDEVRRRWARDFYWISGTAERDENTEAAVEK